MAAICLGLNVLTTYPYHRRPHVLPLQYCGLIWTTIRELRRIIIDILHLYNDLSKRTAAGFPTATATVVCGLDI